MQRGETLLFPTGEKLSFLVCVDQMSRGFVKQRALSIFPERKTSQLVGLYLLALDQQTYFYPRNSSEQSWFPSRGVLGKEDSQKSSCKDVLAAAERRLSMALAGRSGWNQLVEAQIMSSSPALHLFIQQ